MSGACRVIDIADVTADVGLYGKSKKKACEIIIVAQAPLIKTTDISLLTDFISVQCVIRCVYKTNPLHQSLCV